MRYFASVQVPGSEDVCASVFDIFTNEEVIYRSLQASFVLSRSNNAESNRDAVVHE